jgi:cytochrome c553
MALLCLARDERNMNRSFSKGTPVMIHHDSMDKLFRSHCMFKRIAYRLCIAIVTVSAATAYAGDTTPAAQLQRFEAAAGRTGSAEAGRLFFNATHGSKWTCASCHGETPTKVTKHASTGKPIDPLAPSANPAALTDSARVDKWFRRNCKDVLSRECTPTEKSDVIAFLLSLKP